MGEQAWPHDEHPLLAQRAEPFAELEQAGSSAATRHRSRHAEMTFHRQPDLLDATLRCPGCGRSRVPSPPTLVWVRED